MSLDHYKNMDFGHINEHHTESEEELHKELMDQFHNPDHGLIEF